MQDCATTNYEAAREEILERMRLRDQFLLGYVVAVAALFGVAFGVDVERCEVLLIVPYVALAFSVLVSQHHAVIGSLLFFCGKELHPYLTNLSGADATPRWESSETYRSDFRRLLMRRSWAHLVLLLLPPAASLWLNRSLLGSGDALTVFVWIGGLVFTLGAALFIRLGFSFRRRAFPEAKRHRLPGPRPPVISHRGKTRHAHEENTLAAFRAAVSVGVDMVELDLHETKDGKFPVHHDDSPPGECPPWPKISLREGREAFRDSTAAPFLSECLEVLGDTPVNLEVKSFLSISRLGRELQYLPSGSLVSSKHLRILRALKGRSDLPLYLIYNISESRSWWENRRNHLYRVLPFLIPRFLAGISVKQDYLYRGEFCRDLKSRHFRVIAWVVDNPVQIKRLTQLGVDGIITGQPEVALEYRGKSQEGIGCA